MSTCQIIMFTRQISTLTCQKKNIYCCLHGFNKLNTMCHVLINPIGWGTEELYGAFRDLWDIALLISEITLS